MRYYICALVHYSHAVSVSYTYGIPGRPNAPRASVSYAYFHDALPAKDPSAILAYDVRDLASKHVPEITSYQSLFLLLLTHTLLLAHSWYSI